MSFADFILFYLESKLDHIFAWISNLSLDTLNKGPLVQL